MAKGFKKDGDFIPTGDDKKKIKKGSVDNSSDSPPGSVKTGKKLHVEKEEPKQIQQVFDEDGDAIVEDSIFVKGYQIDIPPNAEKDDIVYYFLKENNLWETFKASKGDNKENSRFGIQLEKGFKNADLQVGSPSGSVYLSPDGEWFGGIGAFGYDEDHRPTISKAMMYAGIKLESDDGHGDGGTGQEGKLSGSEEMIHALELSGFMRVGARDGLNLDIYQPITSSQRDALKDFVIENNLGWDDIVVDMNNGMKMPEDNVRRYIGANQDNFNDGEDDYS